MNTQTLNAASRGADSDHRRAGATSDSIFAWVGRFLPTAATRQERVGEARERSPGSRYSQDILHSLSLDEKQRLGLYQLMD